MHLVDDCLMRGQIDLTDSDGQGLPLERSFALRIVDLEILNRNVRRLDMNVEWAVGEMSEQVRVHRQFPTRDIPGEGRLRESLQSRQIDLID